MSQEQRPAHQVQGLRILDTFCSARQFLPIRPSALGIQPQQFLYEQSNRYPGFGGPMPYNIRRFYYSPPINGFWNQTSCPVMAPVSYPFTNMVPVQPNIFCGDSLDSYAGPHSIQHIGVPMAHGSVLMDPASFSGRSEQTHSCFNGFTNEDPASTKGPSTDSSWTFSSANSSAISTGLEPDAPNEETSNQGLPMEKEFVQSKTDAAQPLRTRKDKQSTSTTNCILCKSNNEHKSFYSTHAIKDATGKVVCPILRTYVCPCCNATGDEAHTARYCPKLSSSPKNPAIYTHQPNSVGIPRLVRYI